MGGRTAKRRQATALHRPAFWSAGGLPPLCLLHKTVWILRDEIERLRAIGIKKVSKRPVAVGGAGNSSCKLRGNTVPSGPSVKNASPRPRLLRAGNRSLEFVFLLGKDHPVLWSAEGGTPSARGPEVMAARLVELQAAGHNQDDHHGNKYTGTSPGGLLRYRGHSRRRNRLGERWMIRQAGGGLEVSSYFQFLGELPTCRAWTVVRNTGKEDILLEYVSSLALFDVPAGGGRPWADAMRLHVADNAWCAECQWRSGRLRDFGLAASYPPNGGSGFSLHRIAFSNLGTWSTLEHLPLGAIENVEEGRTLCWQIEHNGSWHWEIGDMAHRLLLRASGPTYREGHWSVRLRSGENFESVPVTFCLVEGGIEAALAELTRARRLLRRPHPDNSALPVIFNDYMNCLFGNPTTEELLPVIEKAAEAGVEHFVVDAGWYAEIGETWWESVGEWKPSKSRFPGGLAEIMEAIRRRGMVPGLWLEIEVMGVQCPLAKELPDAWFFQRAGRRVIDHGRYQLDFRNPAVRAHAARIVNRLVADYGIGYLKMDYNINAGPGTDCRAESPGAGLLEHNRAYLEWITKVQQRHPGLVIENCSSGGLRMDYAQLRVHSIQSVTDQTDYRLNGLIAAACASAVTPEQAAIWSYPLKDGTEEEAIFNMVSVLLGRIHQSGRLDQISAARFDLVREAITLYKGLRAEIPKAIPFWPLGLPRLGDSWAAYGLAGSRRRYLAVWRLGGEESQRRIPLDGVTAASRIDCIYPGARRFRPAFRAGTNQVTITLREPFSARLFKIGPQ